MLVATFVMCGQVAAQENARKDAQPPKNAPVEAATVIDGKQYELIQGAVYEVDRKSGKREFFKQIYEPGFYMKNYTEVDGTTYRVVGNGKKYAVRTSLKEGFEQAKTLHDLVGIERNWTSFTLQGPGAPTVRDYVKLRKRILNRQSGFLDNRIEPSGDRSHNGAQSLRLDAVPPSSTMQLTKASLDTELLHFVKGDHVWLSGWFFVEQGRPTTLMDLECSYIDQGPGMRVLLTKQMRPYLELKWIDKPVYRLLPNLDVTFPRKRWVHVKTHYFLSEKEDGVAELWLDGRKVIEGKGQTLPIAEAVYDRLQVGITANPKGMTTMLYVDDVTVSGKPLERGRGREGERGRGREG